MLDKIEDDRSSPEEGPAFDWRETPDYLRWEQAATQTNKFIGE